MGQLDDDDELGEFSDDFEVIHACGGKLEVVDFYTEKSLEMIDPVVLVMDCMKCGKRIRARLITW